MDFNDDRHLDILGDTFGVFFNRGDGTSQDEIPFTVDSDWADRGLEVADFDDDGGTVGVLRTGWSSKPAWAQSHWPSRSWPVGSRRGPPNRQ
jgi:hypothetical protein